MDIRVLDSLEVAPLSRRDIAEHLGKKTVSGAINRAISRLLKQTYIEYTIPEKPSSRMQKYRLTEKGRDYLSRRIAS